MIGLLSEALGLPVALLVVVAFGLTVALGSGIAGGRREHDEAGVRPAILAS